MNKNEIIQFFDRHAEAWDSYSQPDHRILDDLLDLIGVEADQTVLDIGCGTGVMFLPLLRRNTRKITGIDISAEMVSRATVKFSGDPRVEVICGDADIHCFDSTFDQILIHNAYPHIVVPEHLVRHVRQYLNPGGKFSVAHSIGRERLNDYHRHHCKRNVSRELPPVEQVSELLCRQGFELQASVSDDTMYLVCGQLIRQ